MPHSTGKRSGDGGIGCPGPADARLPAARRGPGGGDTPRVQVFGGYSYTRFDSPSFGFSNPSGLNGYTFSPAFNLIRGFGVVAELSGQYGSNLNLRDITVGPQFSIPMERRCFSAIF